VTMENAAGEGSSHGPVCPHCREPLRSNLRQEQLTPQEPAGPGPKLAMTLTYCGRCGWTLHLGPARMGEAAGPGLWVHEEVAAPVDEQTLEGQFQVRCRGRSTVIKRRARFLARRLDGLGDEPRRGVPRTISHARRRWLSGPWKRSSKPAVEP